MALAMMRNEGAPGIGGVIIEQFTRVLKAGDLVSPRTQRVATYQQASLVIPSELASRMSDLVIGSAGGPNNLRRYPE